LLFSPAVLRPQSSCVSHVAGIVDVNHGA
jgi:hypothetical protein